MAPVTDLVTMRAFVPVAAIGSSGTISSETFWQGGQKQQAFSPRLKSPTSYLHALNFKVAQKMGSSPVAVVAGQPMSGSPTGTYMHGPAAFDIAVTSGMRQSVLTASVTDGSRASTDYEARKCQHLSTLEACTSEGLQFVPLIVEACVAGGSLL